MEHRESFEIPNSGCRQDEPEDAGPGVMDKILVSLIHMKQKTAHLTKSNPSTPTSKRTQAEQLEHNIELLTNSPHNSSSDSGTEINAKGVPDQHHNEAFGNRGEPSPSGSSSAGSARFVQVSASPRGSGRSLRDHGSPPLSPDIPSKDLGEKFMGLLPGSHTNPYAVPQHTTTAAEVNNHSAGPASPSVQRSSTPSSPSILGRLKTERFITKLTDKLHLHSPHLHSPRSATEDPGTPRSTTTGSPTATTTTTTSTPSANTGAPALATDAPTTTMATATGPTEN